MVYTNDKQVTKYNIILKIIIIVVLVFITKFFYQNNCKIDSLLYSLIILDFYNIKVICIVLHIYF